MNGLNIENTLTALRDELCPSSGRRADKLFQGILFSLDMYLAHFADKFSHSERQLVWVIFCGNTNVFYAEQKDAENWDEVPLDSWINSSNHDSCWRTDGLQFVSKIYFRQASAINEALKKVRRNEIAPVRMNCDCNLGHLLGKPFQYVLLDHDFVKGDNYRRHITKLIRSNERGEVI